MFQRYLFRPFILTMVFLILTIVALPRRSFGQMIVSPGVKVSYTFGAQGGFTIGAEVSFLQPHSMGVGGIVTSADYCYCTAQRIRLHAGLELGFLEVGPVYDVTEGYAGLILTALLPAPISNASSHEGNTAKDMEYFYYAHSFMFEHHDLNEIGLYVKYYSTTLGSVEPYFDF